MRGLRRCRGLAECIVVGHGAPKRRASALWSPLRSEDRCRRSTQSMVSLQRRPASVYAAAGGAGRVTRSGQAMARVVGGCVLLYFLLARAAQIFWILLRMFPGLPGRGGRGHAHRPLTLTAMLLFLLVCTSCIHRRHSCKAAAGRELVSPSQEQSFVSY